MDATKAGNITKNTRKVLYLWSIKPSIQIKGLFCFVADEALFSYKSIRLTEKGKSGLSGRKSTSYEWLKRGCYSGKCRNKRSVLRLFRYFTPDLKGKIRINRMAQLSKGIPFDTRIAFANSPHQPLLSGLTFETLQKWL